MIKEVELCEMANDGMDTGSPGHDILDQVEKKGDESCAHVLRCGGTNGRVCGINKERERYRLGSRGH